MRTTGISSGLVRTVAFAVAAGFLTSAAGAGTTGTAKKEPSQAFSLMATRPLSFEANEGQAAEPVRFVARGSHYTLWLSPAETSMSFRKGSRISGLRMKLVGANQGAAIVGLDRQKGRSNYYVGAPSQWRQGVPHFGRVAYQDVYPGVNLVHYGNEGFLEYDFVVAPGADPSAIRFSVEGATKIALQKNGDLLLRTTTGEVVHRAPVVYQERDGVRTPVAGRFVIENKTQIRFEVGRYDAQLALVIDPVLSFSTYLGGTTNDTGFGIAVDSTGGAYVTGQTASINFPTTIGAGRQGTTDAFVTRYDWDGQTLLYSTYLGGSATDHANAIAVDQNDSSAWVTGVTRSSNFPTAGSALQASRPGPTGTDDGFVTKLDAFGAIVYSTYLGGGAADIPHAIAVDGSGNAYVTGETNSTNFPTSSLAFDTTHNGQADIFVTGLDTNGTMLYSTYLGGASGDQGFGVAADAGQAFVAGRSGSAAFPVAGNAFQPVRKGVQDATVTFLDPSGYPTYSTFLGGSADDRALSISTNAGTGNAFIAGQTASSNFPTRRAFQKVNAGGVDAFVAKIVPGAAAASDTLFYSSYLGGSGTDNANGVAVGEFGFAYVTGTTTSNNFPTKNALVPTYGNGTSDAFVSRVSDDGSKLLYSTYLGGSGADEANGIAVTKNDFVSDGNIVVTGSTTSTNFPTDSALQPSKAGAASTSDAFVTRLPFINIEDPSSTSSWAEGSLRQILWTTSLPFGEDLTLELLDGGSTLFSTPVNAGSGSYLFFVPTFTTAPPDNAEVVLSWQARPEIFASSGLFDVGAPSIVVSAPKSGNCWEPGEGRRITWKHNLGAFESYTILLDRDGDTTFEEVIAASVGGAPGTADYDWPAVTPGIDSTLARVRVTSNSFAVTSGTSQAFSILAACSP